MYPSRSFALLSALLVPHAAAPDRPVRRDGVGDQLVVLWVNNFLARTLSIIYDMPPEALFLVWWNA